MSSSPSKTHTTIDKDFIICCAVFIQSPLILLQHVLIDVFMVPASTTTIYRVIFTAVPMLIAIFLCINRRPRLFFFSYLIAVILLLMTIVFFPQNTPYVMSEGLRFLLPVVLPSALCLACVNSIGSSEKALWVMSWIAAFLAFVYILAYLMGYIYFDYYNMSFSYGCLLPMIALFYRKRFYSVVASIILFLAVVAIGSRGAAIVFAFYVVADTLLSNKKGVLFLGFASIVFLLLLPQFSSWLSDYGISSRTIHLYSEGELISYDAGRGDIYEEFSFSSVEHPLIGLGLYGDRYVTRGGYCHNVLLEICVDFGFIIGPLIILFLLFKLYGFYKKSPFDDKRLILKYFCFGLLPLMASSSYLQSPFLSILIGMCCLINNSRKNQVTSI